jgi:hypothetical protein
LWKWTEAEGVAPNAKYNTRYVSAGVKDPAGPIGVNHEHVWTRKDLTTECRTPALAEAVTRFAEVAGWQLAVAVRANTPAGSHSTTGSTTP